MPPGGPRRARRVGAVGISAPYVAAASRARYVAEHYQRAPAMPDALILMAKAYRVLALDALADDANRVLEHNYPSHPGIEEVRAVRVAE